MRMRWSPRMTLKNYEHKCSSMVSILGLMLATVACVTWNRNEKGETSQASGEAVVGQIGSSNTVVSKRPRAYWLSKRNSKDLMGRLKGALATGDADAAETLARSYLAQHPGDAEGFAMLSSALMLGKKYELAAFYAEEAERAQPGKSRSLNIKGLAMVHGTHRNIQDYQAALAMFKKAFEANDKEIAAGLNLGGLYLEMGNPVAASEIFGKVADRCGGCVPALMGQGTGLSRAQKYAEAVQAFDGVLKASPNHPGALYHLALIQKNGFKNLRKAETHLYAVIQNKNPQHAQVRERAQSLLREIKGEATTEERSTLASDSEDIPVVSSTEKSSPKADEAELLMSGAELE